MAEEEKVYKEETHPPSQMLSDALFSSKDMSHVLIVALDKEGAITVWASTTTTMTSVGMLEAAKLQMLGVVREEDDSEEEEEDEGSG